jgi:hypothetical protein
VECGEEEVEEDDLQSTCPMCWTSLTRELQHVVNIPAQAAYDFIQQTVGERFKMRTRSASIGLGPYTLHGLEQLLVFLEDVHPDALLPSINLKQGVRLLGYGKRTWECKITEAETIVDVFGQAVHRKGQSVPPLDCEGSGRIFNEAVWTAWIPPATLRLTAYNKRGTKGGRLELLMNAGSLSAGGWGWRHGERQKNVDSLMNFMGRQVLSLQRDRMTFNRQRQALATAEGRPLLPFESVPQLPQELLRRAFAAAGIQVQAQAVDL